MAWRWRTIFAALAALIFFAFAGLVVAGLPRQGQVGCTDPSTGTEYLTAVWVTRTCSQWHETTDPADTFVPATAWEVYGQSLGATSSAHELIFDVGIGVIAWFAALGCLAIALAIPVNRMKDDTQTPSAVVDEPG